MCTEITIHETVDENFIINPLMDGNASTWVVSIMMLLINWMHDPISLIGCIIAPYMVSYRDHSVQ